jgi:hypothetical protein
MDHTVLVTFDVDDVGEQVTIRLVCNACPGGEYRVSTAHLATLARTFVAVCGVLKLDLAAAAQIIVLGSPEERRATEARYAESLVERHRQG